MFIWLGVTCHHVELTSQWFINESIQSTFFGQYKDSSYHEALVAIASTDIFTSPRAIVSFELYGITRGRPLKNEVLTFLNNTLALIVNLEVKKTFQSSFCKLRKISLGILSELYNKRFFRI